MRNNSTWIEIVDCSVDQQGSYLKAYVIILDQPIAIRWGIDWPTFENFRRATTQFGSLHDVPVTLSRSSWQHQYQQFIQGQATELTGLQFETTTLGQKTIHCSKLFVANITWLSSIISPSGLQPILWVTPTKEPSDLLGDIKLSMPTSNTKRLSLQWTRKGTHAQRVIMAVSSSILGLVLLSIVVKTMHLTLKPNGHVSTSLAHVTSGANATSAIVASANQIQSPNAQTNSQQGLPPLHQITATPIMSYVPQSTTAPSEAAPLNANVTNQQPTGPKINQVAAGTVALTFDDGPSPYTEAILSVLKSHHATASFFFVGYRVARWSKSIQDAANDGFTIGDHSYTHPDFLYLHQDRQAQQIWDAAAEIQKFVPQPIQLFQPPYGDFNQDTFTVLARYQMEMVLWNRDPHDFTTTLPAQVVYNILTDHPSGGIIDLHENATTLAALPIILEDLQAMGLKFVRLKATSTYPGLETRPRNTFGVGNQSTSSNGTEPDNQP